MSITARDIHFMAATSAVLHAAVRQALRRESVADGVFCLKSHVERANVAACSTYCLNRSVQAAVRVHHLCCSLVLVEKNAHCLLYRTCANQRWKHAQSRASDSDRQLGDQEFLRLSHHLLQMAAASSVL